MASDTPVKVGVAVAGLVVLAGIAAGFGLVAGLDPMGDQKPSEAAVSDTPTTTANETTSDWPAGYTPPEDRWFQDVASEKGINYTVTGRQLGNGDGSVLVTDYNNDHRMDVLLVGGPKPVLFENTGGEFERSGEIPALPFEDNRQVKGALFLDYDNDGWDDLILFPLDAEPVFLENDGGSFSVTDVGFDEELAWATGASAGDYDGDGCLDLFVTQNGNWTAGIPDRSANRPYLDDDNGNPNYLYWGNCSGFERATDAGINGTRWSLASSSADFTGDGLPDIHVANDFNRDKIYVNQGNGTFEGHDIPNTDRNGMASDVEDLNGDGLMDIFVTNVRYPNPDEIWVTTQSTNVSNKGNNVLINQGNGTFVDRGEEYGVRQGLWGWSGNVVDLNNDGRLDIIHATKYHIRVTKRNPDERIPTRPAFWVQNASGEFVKQDSEAAGLLVQDARGLAAFDFDGDGDRDVLVSNIVGDFRLYENQRADETGNSWLRVHAAGTRSQTDIGTTVTVTTANGTTKKIQNSKSNYFSQNPRVLGFGLGDADVVETLRVTYPDGTEHVFHDVAVNGTVTVHYDGDLKRVSR
ncbi:MAG: CRTAC1 family protein [Halobacteriaceae archaeon]